MANLTFENATLKLVFQTGINEMGEPIYRSKTFRNLRENVTPERLVHVVQALATLSEDPVEEALIGKTERIEY